MSIRGFIDKEQIKVGEKLTNGDFVWTLCSGSRGLYLKHSNRYELSINNALWDWVHIPDLMRQAELVHVAKYTISDATGNIEISQWFFRTDEDCLSYYSHERAQMNKPPITQVQRIHFTEKKSKKNDDAKGKNRIYT